MIPANSELTILLKDNSENLLLNGFDNTDN